MARCFLSLAITVALLGAGGSARSAEFNERSCAAAVHARLAELDIPEDQVGRTSIRAKERLDSIGSHIDGVEAWIRLESCSGALIIELSQTCQVRQTYLRGECAMLDLTSY